MIIDCPYFDIHKRYPFHIRILEKYDALLKPYGFGISVRDTDHWYHSVRWERYVFNSNTTVDKDVQRITNDLYREFYGTCERCDGIRKDPMLDNMEEVGNADGVFPDDGLYCDDCYFALKVGRIIGYGDIDYFLTKFKEYEKEPNKTVPPKLLQHKIMVMTKKHRITYCKYTELRERDGKWFMICKPRNIIEALFHPSGIEIPAGKTAISVTPLGYDMLLRDVNGERVYSNQTAVLLYKNEIYPIILYELYAAYNAEICNQSKIIVTGYMGHLWGNKILTENYRITFDELVSFVGEHEARKYLKDPHLIV